MNETHSSVEQVTLQAARIVQLEAEIVALREERDQLRASRAELMQTLALLERRILVAKAERVDSGQLELEFAELKRQLDELSGLEPEKDEPAPARKVRSVGRRDLSQLSLPEERVEISDPEMEKRVEAGQAVRIGFEQSYKLGYKRGGTRRLVIARVKYQVKDDVGETALHTTALPAETFNRSLAAPSMMAHVLSAKFTEGMPLFRLEDRFKREGVPIDRGTMSRWVEDAGATFGATVIEAARKDAFANAFVIATDATGIAVQPVPTHEKKSQPCDRGHYFVQIVDGEHVFFEYTRKETSESVKLLFAGYEGYVLADAKSVYEILYRKDSERNEEHEPCVEVACWAHGRRGFWEAALGKEPVAREALFRIGRIFEMDSTFRGLPPQEIKARRHAQLKPQLDSFFEFVEVEWDKVKDQRGKLRSALGYVRNQREALMRFLEDARLPLDNNRSERELRRIAVGRKAWLFVGSDEHAQSTGHVLSLIASARLHGLDPETYLRDLIRILGHWPSGRYLELAPKYWRATRARLRDDQMAAEVGPLDVPPAQS